VAPLALVIAPTRELAIQVNTGALLALIRDAGSHCRLLRRRHGPPPGAEGPAGRLPASGGRHPRPSERSPGAAGTLDLSALRVVVLDEADEMLDMGFREDLEEILRLRRRKAAGPCCSRRPSPRKSPASPVATRPTPCGSTRSTRRQPGPRATSNTRVIRIAPNEIEHAVVNVLAPVRSAGRPGLLQYP